MGVGLKSRQQGLSFFGMLFVGVVVAAIGAIGIQVFPTVIEYLTIQKTVNKAKEGHTVDEVRAIFDRYSSIDQVTSLTGKDLEITKESDQTVVAFSYQREIHLFGPAWLVLKYSGRSK